MLRVKHDTSFLLSIPRSIESRVALPLSARAEAVTKVLQELAAVKAVSSTNLSDVLNDVLNEGGVHLAQLNGSKKRLAKLFKKIQKGQHVPLTLGRSYIDGEGQTIDLQETPVFPSSIINVSADQDRYVSRLMHELFHHVRKNGLFSHNQVATAISRVDKSFKPTGDDDDDSDALDQFINKYCPPKS